MHAGLLTLKDQRNTGLFHKNKQANLNNKEDLTGHEGKGKKVELNFQKSVKNREFHEDNNGMVRNILFY